MKNIFVTGGVGFVGSHLIERLLTEGNSVVTIDNFNDFYDPQLKEDNHQTLLNCVAKTNNSFKLYKGDIMDVELMTKIFDENNFDVVIYSSNKQYTSSGIRRIF